mgnify:FL=1|jgi:hypothetical protein
MTILPKAIISVNNDISLSVKEMLQRQLFIDETLDGYVFDSYITNDINYLDNIIKSQTRLLVIRDALDLSNRDICDIVVFIKLGLAAIEQNKFGPHGQTYPVVNLTWSKLGIY